MGLLNYLEFDGINSLSYGVIISGEGVFDAPKRRAERISVPGRNGDLILDEGVFDNIRVSYPAFIVARNEAEFRERFQAFRSMLLSRASYVKLTDSYHGDEYRMAAYLDGLEVDPKLHNKAGNFTLTFDCKPQRFLKIGEIPVPIESGDTITNPTLFDAKPLVKFNASSSGSITIGDKVVQFYNAPLGLIPLGIDVGAQYESASDTQQVVTFSGSYNIGDAFTIEGAKATLTLIAPDVIHSIVFNGVDLAYNPYESKTSGRISTQTWEEKAETSFVIGTSKTVTKNSSIYITFGGSTYTVGIRLTIVYSGGNQIQYRWTIVPNGSGVTYGQIDIKSNYSIICDSTANSLTGDLYMDLDIGEAYRIENGNVVSINNFTNLGGELPTLPPGSTTISYDNAISNVEITPRWWRV